MISYYILVTILLVSVSKQQTITGFFLSGAHTNFSATEKPGEVSGNYDKTNNTEPIDHIIIYWRKLSSFGQKNFAKC